jgi:hypothetical protein
MRSLDWTCRLARWILGIIFIYAGWAKLLEPEIFAVLLDAFGILPEPFLRPVSLGLPTLEVMAGLGLILDVRGSLPVITGLLLMFTGILGYGIRMGLDVDCGCFGPGDPESKAFHGLKTSFCRDLAMLATVAVIYGLRRYRDIKPLKIKELTKPFQKRRTEDAYG